MAAQAGIPAARAESQVFGGRDVLVVERFDRASDRGGTTRIHQEDACQALGRLPVSKYEDEPDGVTWIEIFALIDRFAASPATERLGLFDQVVANFVLGNADAHAKNVAILYAERSLGTIAPLYDVVCTAAYPELHTRMALSIGGARDLSDVGPEAFGELARQVGMNPRQAQRRAADVARRLANCATTMAARAKDTGAAQRLIDEIAGLATRHAARISI